MPARIKQRRNEVPSIEDALDRLCPSGSKHGHIYFLWPIFSRTAIKIGFSIDPARRMYDLQSGHPELLDIIDMFPATWSVEKRIHDRFKHLKIHREWFERDAELLEYIEDLAEAQAVGEPLRF